jgi:hypothetical protein
MWEEENDRLQRVVTMTAVILFCIQAFILFLYLCSKQIGEGTPVLLWDQFGYYQDAIRLYQKFSIDSLQNTTRPIFSLFSLALFRILSIPLNSVVLIICNAFLFQAILLISIVWITRLLKQSFLTAILTALIIWTTPQFFQLSSDLWGDIPTAAWVFLYTALLIFVNVSEFSVIGGLLLGVVAAFGFQIKPIFIFYLVVSTGVFYISSFLSLWRRFLELDFLFKGIAHCGATLLSFLTLIHFIFPKKLPQLIKDLNYNNEILGYWQVQRGIYNSWLWFVNVLRENFTIPVLILLLVAGIGAVIVAMQKLRSVITKWKETPWQDFRLDAYLQLSITFFVCLIYISFFVRSKDIRTVFFLFPLCILIGVIYIEKLLYTQRKVFALIVLALVIFHSLFILSWSKPNIQPIDTYEKLGIEQSITFLEGLRKNKEVLTVFVTHNSWRYNDANFVSFYSLQKSIYPQSPPPDIGLWFKSAPFNFGGWGSDGGVPKSFFTSNYILTVPEHPYGAFNDRKIEIYNFLTQEALAKEQADFMEGLTKVYTQQNANQETIVIYQRNRLPSPKSFVKIVAQYAAADPNNLFNVPFLYAALQIDPSLTELRSQLETMAKSEFLASVPYHFNDPQKEEKVKELLKMYPKKSFPEFTYPRLLEE